MLDAWLRFVVAISNGWALGLSLLLCVVFVLLFGVTRAGMREHGGGLDGRFGYAPREVQPALDELNEAGLLPRYLWTEATLDMVFPLIYPAFLAIAMVLLLPAGSPWLLLTLLPAGLALADYLENLTVIALLVRYPETMPPASVAASVFSATKWALLGLSSVALLGVAIHRLLRAF